LKFSVVKGMRVDIDGESWRVIDIHRLYSGNDVVAYQLQLRH